MYERLMILDTETGGLDPEQHSLLDIGLVVIDENNNVLFEYESLIKSVDGTYHIHPLAYEMHKITPQMCDEKGKLPKEIIADMAKIRDTFFDGKPITIIAHNSAFDLGFVKKMFKENSTEKEYAYNKVISRNALDTASMTLQLMRMGVLKLEGRPSLDALIEHYNVKQNSEKRHGALFDAQQTRLVFDGLDKDTRKGLNLSAENSMEQTK